MGARGYGVRVAEVAVDPTGEREPFSVRVRSAGWLGEVTGWIGARVAEAGRELTGPIEQRRVRPWSTQLVAPTDHGLLWFKANCAPMAFEAALHRLLAELMPSGIAAPLAVDAERGWLLTADRGPTLGDDHQPTLADWRFVVGQAARLQRQLAQHREALLGTGLPDCSPRSVPERFDAVLRQLRSLPAGHPGRLSADEAASLAGQRDRVAAAAAELAAATLPVTLQHGDLHPRNVFAADRSQFDFGDAQWAAAVEVLCVPQAVVEDGGEVPWAEVLDAYATVWDDLASAAELRSQIAAAAVTNPVNRAETWLAALAEATPGEAADWGEAPRRQLLRLLDP